MCQELARKPRRLGQPQFDGGEVELELHTGVNRVPVPQHLVFKLGCVANRSRSQLTEILQPISMPCIPPALEAMVPDAVDVGGIDVVIDPMDSILNVLLRWRIGLTAIY